MTKIRVTETRFIEFELNPDFYEEGATIDDMIAIELDSAKTHVEYFDVYDSDSMEFGTDLSAVIVSEDQKPDLVVPDLAVVKNEDGSTTEIVLLADDEDPEEDETSA